MKRILIITAIIVFIVIIVLISNKIFNNDTYIANEIVPEEEISDSQLRNTIITLYFKNKNVLVPEARYIDAKELITDPYNKILDLLIKGPKNGNLEGTIPYGTQINSISKHDDYLIIDFTKEFIENHNGGKEEEIITIRSIVNTVTEFTEINGIKILIDGEENKSYKDNQITFNNIFKRDLIEQ